MCKTHVYVHIRIEAQQSGSKSRARSWSIICIDVSRNLEANLYASIFSRVYKQCLVNPMFNFHMCLQADAHALALAPTLGSGSGPMRISCIDACRVVLGRSTTTLI